jgi:hypothetical protein
MPTWYLGVPPARVWATDTPSCLARRRLPLFLRRVRFADQGPALQFDALPSVLQQGPSRLGLCGAM